MQITPTGPTAFALLIGVNDYTDFSSSGKDNLQGAVNDAFAAARLAFALGVPPQNIHLCLAEPGSTSEDLRCRLDPAIAGAHVHGATHHEVLDGIGWLAEAMAMPQAKGLLWFAGHGFADAAGPALCPSDIRSGEGRPQNLLENAEVLERLSVRHPESKLTVFIDACHSAAEGADGMHSRALSASLNIASPDGIDLCYERYGNIVAVAARAHEQGWELTGSDDRHGAFSWAVLTVLRRWGVTNRALDEGRIDRFVDLTYADLMDKVRRLLDALEVKQRPVLYAPTMMLNTTVFHGFGNTDMISAAPDNDGGRELYPGSQGEVLEYTVNSATSSSKMYIAGPSLTGTTGQNWASKRIYLDDGLPSADFSTSGGTVDVGPTLSPKATWRTFDDLDLAAYSGPTTVVPGWLITTGDYYGGSGGYTIIGGLTLEDDDPYKLRWYRTDYDMATMPSRIASTATTTLYFTWNDTLQKPITPQWEQLDVEL